MNLDKMSTSDIVDIWKDVRRLPRLMFVLKYGVNKERFKREARIWLTEFLLHNATDCS